MDIELARLVGCAAIMASAMGCSYEQKTFAQAQDTVRGDMMSTAARGIYYVGSDADWHRFIQRWILSPDRHFKVARAEMDIGKEEFAFSRWSSKESPAWGWFKVEFPKPHPSGLYRIENGGDRPIEDLPAPLGDGILKIGPTIPLH